MAYNTNNPLGSSDFKDLSDNAVNFDKYSNGADPAYPNRFGELKLSIEGMNQEFNNAQEGREVQFIERLNSLGYVWVGDYAAGLTFTSRIQYTVREGVLYRVAPATTLPYTTTGTWATDQTQFVAFDSEALLKQDLANTADPTLGAALVGRSVLSVASIADLLAARKDPSQLVYVRGYHGGTNYGGGTMPRFWDATRSKADHNGGTIIDPDKALPTDWSNLASVQAWFAPGTGSGCWVSVGSSKNLSVTEFGAIPDDPGINNHPMYAACAVAGGVGATILFPPGTYRMHWFVGYDHQTVVGYGATLDLFKLTGGPTVLAVGGNFGKYFGFVLNCLEADLPNVRTSVEDREGSYWEEVSFIGFRDSREPNLNTAWGLYAKRSKNHTFFNCYWENNSQNDIAILEDCDNIRVIAPRGLALNINLEPNTDVPKTSGITITDATISILLVQENTLVGVSNNRVTVERCRILQAKYDGGSVEFINCTIENLQPSPDGVGRCYAGPLRLNGAVGLSPNLLSDPALVSVSATDTGSTWQLYTSTITPLARYTGISTSVGRGLKLNPTNVSGTCSLKSESVPVGPGQKFLVAALTAADYPVGAAVIGLQMGVRWLDGSGVDISITLTPINRAPIPTSATSVAPTSFQAAVVVAPAGAAFAQILIGSTLSSASTGSSNWYHVGFHRITDIVATMSSHVTDPTKLYVAETGYLEGVGAAIPSSSPTQFYYRDYLAGDRIAFKTPAPAGYMGAVCTASGTPGTWKGYGLVQA